MNLDFTEKWDQSMRQLEWLTNALRQRALVYAELPLAEKFSHYCRHSHKDWRAMQRRQVQWHAWQHPFD